MEQNTQCKNIHGSISYDLASKAANQLIFGIESNRDFHNNNFRIFTKSIRRSVDANFGHSLNTYLCGVKKVIIYGHSLNEMDHNIIKHILEYAMDNYDKNRQQMHKKKFEWAFPFQIVLYYYDRTSHFELAYNLEIILGSERYNKMIANNQIEYICSKED